MDIDSRVEKIDVERHTQGISIQQLADMCQLSASTVSRTLSGKTAPTEYTLHAMEEVLGITGSTDGEPITEGLRNDPIVERYIRMQESRIARLRAFYNRELAEKDRWIKFLLVLSLLLVVLLLAFCLLMESPL